MTNAQWRNGSPVIKSTWTHYKQGKHSSWAKYHSWNRITVTFKEVLKGYIENRTPLYMLLCTLFRSVSCHAMSFSVTAYPFPWGRGVLLQESIPTLSEGEGRVLPGQFSSLSQGPHWWEMWGSVSCARTLRHAAQPCPAPSITSRPALPTELQPPLFRSMWHLSTISKCKSFGRFALLFQLWRANNIIIHYIL